MGFLISARLEMWSKGINLNFGHRNPSGTLSVAKPLVFVEQQEGEHIEPCLQLEIKEAQKLMDELWNCGLRPSEGTGSAGSLAATERHLKDMRAITKGLLRKDGVYVVVGNGE